MSIRALTENGNTPVGAITPDGRFVAYVKRELGNYELRLLQVATERDVQVLPPSPLRIGATRFSPDGNFIYFLRQSEQRDGPIDGVRGDLFRIAALGGPATPLASNAKITSLTVSPDGKQIAYIERSPNESSIVAINNDGSHRKVLVKRSTAYSFWFLEWSRSPNMLAVSYDAPSSWMPLATLELPGGSIHELNSSWSMLGQPAWSADGKEIFAPTSGTDGGTSQIWRFDAHTGADRPLTSNSTKFSISNLSATATNDLVATTVGGALTLSVIDQHAQTHSIPSLRTEGEDSVAWVGDYLISSNAAEMIVHDLRAQSSMKLRPFSEERYHYLTSCGPTQIAFVATSKDRGEHIARTDITTGLTTELTLGPSDEWLTCTRDGSRLIYLSYPKQGRGSYSLMEKSIGSESAFELRGFDQSRPVSLAISPDGKNLLFQIAHLSGEPCEWAMMPVSGGDLKKLSGLPPPSCQEQGGFKWAPDGRSILYKISENGVDNIWSVPFTGGKPRKLTDFRSDLIFAFDVSSDNGLVLSRGTLVNDLVLLQNVH